VDKTTDQQPKVQQFETDLDLEIFLLKFLDLIIHHEVPKLKLFSKTTPQPNVQQFESTGFQDPQTAAETSDSYYYSSVGKNGRKVRGQRKNRSQ
jgi:hypothetical protein